jgi:hypothetical protein
MATAFKTMRVSLLSMPEPNVKPGTGRRGENLPAPQQQPKVRRNQDGVRARKPEKEKRFSCAELLSLDGAGLMGVRLRLVNLFHPPL